MRQVYPFLHDCWHRYLYRNSKRKIHFLSPLAGEKNFGWYIWLGCRGVYELQVQQWFEEENYEESSFILKYYPHPDDDLFDSFGFYEQLARVSGIFDDSPIVNADGSMCVCSYINRGSKEDYGCLIKGIPKINARKMLEPDMFQIGKISFGLKGNRLIKVSGESQDILVNIASAGLTVEGNGQKTQILAPGDVDRRVLGWELTWSFLSIFTAEVIGQLDLAPTRKQRYSRPGTIHYYGERGEAWTEESQHLSVIKYTLFYGEGN